MIKENVEGLQLNETNQRLVELMMPIYWAKT
jgi:hypothetical protein